MFAIYYGGLSRTVSYVLLFWTKWNIRRSRQILYGRSRPFEQHGCRKGCLALLQHIQQAKLGNGGCIFGYGDPELSTRAFLMSE